MLAATRTRQTAEAPSCLVDDLCTALDASGDRLLIVDADNMVLWCSSACRLLHEELQLGGSLYRVPELARLLSHPIDDHRSVLLDAALGENEGQCKAQRYRLDVTHLNGGRKALRFIPSTNDDTYLRQYMADREKLFSTSRTISVSEMATTLAHEINQPVGTLSNILTGLQLRLKREGDLPDNIARALNKAGEQVVFIADIIARIRDFTEARQPRLVECEVHGLITRSINLLDWVFDSAKVSVRFSMTDDSLCVIGDSTLLQQVVTNLCRNAVDAMRGNDAQSRHLDITAMHTSDGVLIKVSDDGEGLSADAQASVFVPFVTRKAHGMGVGLNICRSLVELHQGRLWLTGNEAEGCTAHVLLPECIRTQETLAPIDDHSVTGRQREVGSEERGR